MPKEVLFTIAQDISYNSTDLVGKLEGLSKKRFEQHYDPDFLQAYIERVKKAKDSGSFSFNWYPHNAPGQWMSKNIQTPNEVVTESISLERVQQELESGKFEHIVISVYLSGFSTFREIAMYVREKYPEVKVIASSVGALLPESRDLSDYQLKGDQVTDLRKILGQNPDDPLTPVTIQSDTETQFGSITKKSKYALLVSSFGCMYGCDFCPATAQHGREYTAPFTAEEIREAIIGAHDSISPGSDTFTVSVAEPQGLGNIPLWREVFKRCQSMPFQCELVSTTSSKVMQKYSIDELTSGDLRLSTVNIGVESLLQSYKKNEGVDLRTLNERLQSAGINVVSTYIVGLDWQTKDNIREEVKQLKALGSSGYIVANLEMQPNTPLYDQFKSEGRLMNVPPELLSFYGYQAYTHPEFSPGFNDMLPLLGDIEDELADGNQTLNANLRVFLKRQNVSESAKRTQIEQALGSFDSGFNPNGNEEERAKLSSKFAAELYFHIAFRNMDLFHPFILSTN